MNFVLLAVESGGTLQAAVAVVATAILFAIGLFFRSQAKAIEANFRLAVELAYELAKVVAPRTGNTVDDTVAAALGYLKEFLSSQGRELTVPNEAKAVEMFKTMAAGETV